MKNVLVCGGDGFIGFPLVMYLARKGHNVLAADNYLRRRTVTKVGGQSIFPIKNMNDRQIAFEEAFGKTFEFFYADLTDYYYVDKILKTHLPDVIVNLAQIPSAPYSMRDVGSAIETQMNNIAVSMNLLWAMNKHTPDAHMISLGTLGEFGTPEIDIPEDDNWDIEWRGRKPNKPFPFPRGPGSFYHCSKVQITENLRLACKIWDLRCTDIQQGVIYGTKTDEVVNEELRTRFDVDNVFGTAVGRFCAQAVLGHPITPYGKGHHLRGFIQLRDALRCIELIMKNPPEAGKYRSINQYNEIYDITDLANTVNNIAISLGLMPKIENIDNPRIELEEHYYKVDHKLLYEFGFAPKHKLEEEITIMIQDLIPHHHRIKHIESVIDPTVTWRDGIYMALRCPDCRTGELTYLLGAGCVFSCSNNDCKNHGSGSDITLKKALELGIIHGEDYQDLIPSDDHANCNSHKE